MTGGDDSVVVCVICNRPGAKKDMTEEGEPAHYDCMEAREMKQ